MPLSLLPFCGLHHWLLALTKAKALFAPSYFEQAKWLIINEKKKLGAKYLQFKFHEIFQSALESATGRGDRRLGDVIEYAWRKGARFDLWSESFKPEIWQEAFAKHGMNLDIAAQRQFAADEILPWEHLGGPDKDYLLKHLANSEIS